MNEKIKPKKGHKIQSVSTLIVLKDKGTQVDPETETKGGRGGIKK